MTDDKAYDAMKANQASNFTEALVMLLKENIGVVDEAMDGDLVPSMSFEQAMPGLQNRNQIILQDAAGFIVRITVTFEEDGLDAEGGYWGTLADLGEEA